MSTINIDLDGILERVGIVCGEKTDKGIAKRLGLTRQAITNARKRGSIPYERLCSFAVEHNVSLDYLLLGLRALARLDGEVNPYLFKDIEKTLYEDSKYIDGKPLIEDIELLSYYSANIYNKIIKALKPGEDWTDMVNTEVWFVLDILRDKNLDEEKANEIEAEKSLLKDAQVDAEIGKGVKITQDISGNDHNIAGRDFINNKDK